MAGTPLPIFREYILNLNYFPPEIINPDTQHFDFILGFASDHGDGEFVPNWNDALTPEMVEELKTEHPNVRVVISIGGVRSEFNPLQGINDWVANAVRSIRRIIMKYKSNSIDGIDIHYDVIRSTEAVFSDYIGRVIQELKNDINVVSIAPTENVQSHYLQLYSDNPTNIDWVDYRFYNQYFASVLEFTNSYNGVVAAFRANGKVLAGISIPQDPNIFNGIVHLIRSNPNMPGVFVWNADESLEKYLQNL